MLMQQEMIPATEVIRSEGYSPNFLDYDALEVSEKENVGMNLRRCRSLLKISREKAAVKLGMSSSQYRKYEEGRDWMRMHTAMRFMMEFGIPFTWLFAGGVYGEWCPSREEIKRWLSIQVLVGCCNDQEFNTFIALLRDRVTGVKNVQSYHAIEAWPSNEDVLSEESQYYDFVADGLKRFRHEYGLSRHQMAELLGVDCRTQLGYEEKGNQTCFSMLMAMRFWAATGMPPLYLIKGTALYRRRVLQHERMDWLQAVLQHLSKPEQEKVARIANFIRAV